MPRLVHEADREICPAAAQRPALAPGHDDLVSARLEHALRGIEVRRLPPRVERIGEKDDPLRALHADARTPAPMPRGQRPPPIEAERLDRGARARHALSHSEERLQAREPWREPRQVADDPIV